MTAWSMLKLPKIVSPSHFKDIDVLDVNAKIKTATSSENSVGKSTQNEQLEVLYKHTICTGVS